MKRILATLVAALMLVAVLAACGGGDSTSPAPTPTPGASDPTPTPDNGGDTGGEPEGPDVLAEERDALIAQAQALPAASGQIIRGSTTDVNEYMWSGMWQNSASNSDIWYMIHRSGYPTIAFVKDGYYEVNPIVTRDFSVNANDDGSKTYYFEIYDDLKWSDGSAITAKDYVFAALLGISPQFGEIDADNSGGEIYVGGSAYTAGETTTLAGFRLLGDYKFSLTIAAEELPNHYEFGLAAMSPLPMAVIAPGVTINDSDAGVSLSDNFTTELIRETILNETTGYAYAPKATDGPYKWESYDASTKTAILVANDQYLSTWDGYKPQIQKIILKKVETATMMDELSTGAVDLLDGTSSGDEINKGLDLVDKGGYDYFNYPRNGFGYFAFKCDRSPTQFAAVRLAVAYCLDREEFANSYAKGYAMVVDGYYGASQPEYQAKQDELEAKLTHYTLNQAKAIETLVNDGWTKNKTGGDYVDGSGEARYKEFTDAEIATFDDFTKSIMTGNLMPLQIEWISSENNPVSDLLTTMLLPATDAIGIKINKTVTDFSTLLTNLYRDGVPDSPYTMLNLATGFEEMNLYWYDFSPEEEYLNNWNQTNIKDEKLFDIASKMKVVPAEDNDTWLNLWVQLQVRYNELMPLVPLYSNDYHDFFNAKIQGYDVSPVWNWARGIIRCSLG